MLRARSDISGISDSDGDETYVTIEGRMTDDDEDNEAGMGE